MNNSYRSKKPSQKSISTQRLLSFFFPELITVSLLYIGLEIINFRFIACTDIAMCNTTLFVSNSLLHFITKIAEGFSVGMVIICGNYNGAGDYQKTGAMLSNAFWVTAIAGGTLALLLYCGAYSIYAYYDMPQEIIQLGVPYLKIRSIGVFFSFIYFAIIGFLRGIQNPKVPMFFFLIGALVYLVCDYGLIFGAWGLPKLGLTGSAIATVIQFGVMLIAALVYILCHKRLHKYTIRLFAPLSLSHIHNLIYVSWPVMIDKASLALCPIWLNKMVGCTAKLTTPHTGQTLLDSLTVLKTMERVGILPALAFAQIITYLVSNDYKIQNFLIIKNNIKKVLFIACILTAFFTLLFYVKPHFFLALLHKQSAYNDFIIYGLPLIAFLIIFDVLQLILAAALRGAADVKTVMVARLTVTGLFFIPLAYGISLLPITNMLIKFMLLYCSVHISFALMALIYIIRFKSGIWKKQSTKG